jgi:O-antigen ligase
MIVRSGDSNGPPDVPLLDRLLFAVLAGVLCARPLISESFARASLSFLPVATPGGTSPATTVWLDVILLVATVLIWIRHWRHLPGPLVVAALGLLLAAVVVSVTVAGDKRQAANAGAHLFVMALAATALVRVLRARWMVHVLLAALLASGFTNATKCLMQRSYEFDASLEQWQQQKAALAADGVDVEAPDIVNYERRLRSGEAFGYLFHPNVTASCLMMCSLIAVGILIGVLRKPGLKTDQRIAATLIVGLLVVRLVTGVWSTGSMGAGVAGGVAGLALLSLGLTRQWVAKHARRVFALLALAYVGVMAIGAGYGILKGTLPHTSLAFRWQYWQAAARAYADEPLTGIGRENFRAAYLLHKVPESTEEVSNPHDLWLTLLVELGPLGLIAGALLIAIGLRRALGALGPACPPAGTRVATGAMIVAALSALLLLTLLQLVSELGLTGLTAGANLVAIALSISITIGARHSAGHLSSARIRMGAVIVVAAVVLLLLSLVILLAGLPRPYRWIALTLLIATAHGIALVTLKKAGYPPSARARMGVAILVAASVLVVQALFSGEPFGAPGILFLWLTYVAGGWLLAFALGYLAIALADEDLQTSHWLAAALVAALCAALIHNLIGIAFFTPAGLAVFVAIAACGCALGRRTPDRATADRTPAVYRALLAALPIGLGAFLLSVHVCVIARPTIRTQSTLERIEAELRAAPTPIDAYAALRRAGEALPSDDWLEDPTVPRWGAEMALQLAESGGLPDELRIESCRLAADYAKQAIRCTPHSFAGRQLQARILQWWAQNTKEPDRSRHLLEADAAWSAAISLYPTNPWARVAAAGVQFQLWRRTGEERFARNAIANYDAALAIDALRAPEVAAKLSPAVRRTIRAHLNELQAVGLERPAVPP